MTARSGQAGEAVPDQSAGTKPGFSRTTGSGVTFSSFQAFAGLKFSSFKFSIVRDQARVLTGGGRRAHGRPAVASTPRQAWGDSRRLARPCLAGKLPLAERQPGLVLLTPVCSRLLLLIYSGLLRSFRLIPMSDYPGRSVGSDSLRL